MNTPDTSFSFKLSSVELHWLAGAFGITSLPIPKAEQNEKSQLADGLRSLQERGLVQKSAGQDWQVDQLPSAIVGWLASAVSTLLLDIHRRNGASDRVLLFRDHEVTMHIAMKENEYHFVLFSDDETMIVHLLNSLGALHLNSKLDAGKYRLSQPATILKSVWIDPILTAKMLKITGLHQNEVGTILEWAKGIDWVVFLNRFQLDEPDPEVGRQAILCGTADQCWAANLNNDASSEAEFIPADLEKVCAIICNLV